MKTLVLVAAIFFVAGLRVIGEDSNGLLNGLDWSEMSATEKAMYVRAVHDVAVVSPIFVAKRIRKGQEEVAKATLGALNDFVLTGLYPEEVIGALDGFYRNPLNSRIPILLAIRWSKLKGPERDAEAAKLRETYPKDGR